jgi:hypothetical protein
MDSRRPLIDQRSKLRAKLRKNPNHHLVAKWMDRLNQLDQRIAESDHMPGRSRVSQLKQNIATIRRKVNANPRHRLIDKWLTQLTAYESELLDALKLRTVLHVKQVKFNRLSVLKGIIRKEQKRSKGCVTPRLDRALMLLAELLKRKRALASRIKLFSYYKNHESNKQVQRQRAQIARDNLGESYLRSLVARNLKVTTREVSNTQIQEARLRLLGARMK